MQRIEIAKVAATVQGVNADNFIKFCETLEGWVSANADPLRLKVPAPAQRGDSRIKWKRGELVRSMVDGSVVVRVDVPDIDDKFFNGTVIESGGLLFNVGDSLALRKEMFQKFEPTEIDWSRPQLVIGNGAYHGVILKTTGLHTDSHFFGRAVEASMPASWPKEDFRYHGEIPQKQQQ